MAIVEGGVELIDADAGGGEVSVVTADAVLFEEGLDLLFKRRLKGGGFWHRFSFDGYGERRDGKSWRLFPDDTRRTLGRAWPIFAGERGEYELLAGRRATELLAAMAGTANDGGMLPEQVWDGREPTGKPGFTKGQGTFSATPLAWTHAQLIRLAWSIEARTPVELPQLVVSRYG